MALACLGVALVASAPVPAFASDQAPIEAGIRAYRAGDFAAALQFFEAARAQGADGDALVFNLGLTQYRLGNYGAARRTFLELRQRPDMTALAEYHLGLTAAQVGQMERATTHLRAAAAGESAELRQLALTALDRLTDRPVGREPAGYVAFGFGYDDNRNQISETIRIPGPAAESAYAEFSGVLQYPLPRLPDTDLRATLFRRDYEKDDALDQTALLLSLRRAWRANLWRITLAAESDFAFLEGDSLLNAYGISLESVRRVGPSTLRLRYRPSAIQAGPDYEYLDGQRHRAEIAQEFLLGDFQLRAGYEAEINDRRDLAAGQQFFSQSPTRHGPYLRVSRSLTPDLTVDINAAFRHSRYGDANRFFVGTTLQSERRVEDLGLVACTVRLRITPVWGLRLDYRYTDNDSSVATYDYTRHMAMLAVDWRY